MRLQERLAVEEKMLRSYLKMLKKRKAARKKQLVSSKVKDAAKGVLQKDFF
ncbi:MAG: hypothetical protein AB1374_01220 [Bacillota bacterium]